MLQHMDSQVSDSIFLDIIMQYRVKLIYIFESYYLWSQDTEAPDFMEKEFTAADKKKTYFRR